VAPDMPTSTMDRCDTPPYVSNPFHVVSGAHSSVDAAASAGGSCPRRGGVMPRCLPTPPPPTVGAPPPGIWATVSSPPIEPSTIPPPSQIAAFGAKPLTGNVQRFATLSPSPSLLVAGGGG
jgi:hypothetical protein